MTIEQMKNDFNDIENILTNENHVVRKYFRMFLNGDYGQEIFEKYYKQWHNCKNTRNKRSFIINAFIEFNCFDYDLSRYQVKKFLLNAFKDIEVLNEILINDAEQVYIELNY